MEKTHLDPTRAALPRPPGELPAASGPPDAAPAGRLPGPPASLTELRNLDQFRILRLLGEGGMGAVYLAFDGRNDRHLAVKVLNEQMASNQNYIDRFHREARNGTLLNHPNIVRTYQANVDARMGKHYLVMEFVDGPSAQALMAQQEQLAVGDAVHIALDIARALEHAHSRNIVHRDIKPDNILITRAGVAKLADMGLAKRTDEASHLTAARQGFGTTAYMPYEQAISAKYADGRSDLYALGATLYHLLTGRVPFPGDNHLEVVEKKKQGHFRPARTCNPAVPIELDQILARMMARQPRDRYQTASELIIDLERSQLSAPVPSFADAKLARQDPWVQACLKGAEPTRLDPAAPASGRPTVRPDGEANEMWIVRYHNRLGRRVTARLSTDDIVDRLHQGTLSDEALLRRPSEDDFQPLACHAVFRPHLADSTAWAARTSGQQRQRLLPLLLVSAAVLAGMGLALARWLGLF